MAHRRAVLASMDDGVVAVDEEQQVLAVNRAVLEQLSFSNPRPDGLHLWEVTRQRDALELVERCLDRLGSPDADVLRLKHLQGLTFEEVADLTGDSVNTIKSRHYRGLTKLRSMLGLGAVAS